MQISEWLKKLVRITSWYQCNPNSLGWRQRQTSISVARRQFGSQLHSEVLASHVCAHYILLLCGDNSQVVCVRVDEHQKRLSH
jgi:hypothetical protein